VAQLHEDLLRFLDGQFEFGSVGLVETVVVADLKSQGVLMSVEDFIHQPVVLLSQCAEPADV
jgi:hypothetical protein